MMHANEEAEVGAALRIQAASRARATKRLLATMRMTGQLARAVRKLQSVAQAQAVAQRAVADDKAGNGAHAAAIPPKWWLFGYVYIYLRCVCVWLLCCCSLTRACALRIATAQWTRRSPATGRASWTYATT